MNRGESGSIRTFLRNNGLAIVLLALFAGSLIGHTVAGYRVDSDERASHGESQRSLGAYVSSGAYLESVTENWESEFLQMGMFVLLTVSLIQIGSPESKPVERIASIPH